MLSGCCFVCLDFTVDETIESDDLYGPLSGQIVSIVKEGCRRAFQAHPQRSEFHIWPLLFFPMENSCIRDN